MLGERTDLKNAVPVAVHTGGRGGGCRVGGCHSDYVRNEHMVDLLQGLAQKVLARP